MSNQTASKSQSQAKTCSLRVWDGQTWYELEVKKGANLRKTLQKNNLSPHDSITRYLNCCGRGVCALCSVRLDSAEPEPQQWLDNLTAKFGWRLSCKISVKRDLVVRLV